MVEDGGSKINLGNRTQDIKNDSNAADDKKAARC